MCGGGDLDIGLGIIEWNINCLLAVSWMVRKLVGCFFGCLVCQVGWIIQLGWLAGWFVRQTGCFNQMLPMAAAATSGSPSSFNSQSTSPSLSLNLCQR